MNLMINRDSWVWNVVRAVGKIGLEFVW